MKKLLALVFTAALVTGFVACGPSEEEKKADSLDVIKQANENDDLADSIFKAMEAMNASDTGKKDSAKK